MPVGVVECLVDSADHVVGPGYFCLAALDGLQHIVELVTHVDHGHLPASSFTTLQPRDVFHPIVLEQLLVAPVLGMNISCLSEDCFNDKERILLDVVWHGHSSEALVTEHNSTVECTLQGQVFHDGHVLA